MILNFIALWGFVRCSHLSSRRNENVDDEINDILYDLNNEKKDNFDFKDRTKKRRHAHINDIKDDIDFDNDNGNFGRHSKGRKRNDEADDFNIVCHEHAKLVDGECKCLHGYTGDGIDYCKAETPNIVDVKKENDFLVVTTDGLIIDATDAFCKINRKISKAISIEDNLIRCSIPEDENEKLLVAVSYDRKDWSMKYEFSNKIVDQNVELGEVNNLSDLIIKTVVIVIIVIALVFLIYRLYKCFFGGKKQFVNSNSTFIQSKLPVTLNKRFKMNEQDDSFNVCFEPIDESS